MNDLKYSSDSFDLAFDEDEGILVSKAKSKQISLAMAKEGVAARLDLMEGHDALLFFDICSIASISRDARKYFSEPISQVGLIASALLVNSEIQRMLINTFVLLYEPKVPIKLFTSKAKAIKWLKAQ